MTIFQAHSTNESQQSIIINSIKSCYSTTEGRECLDILSPDSIILVHMHLILANMYVTVTNYCNAKSKE